MIKGCVQLKWKLRLGVGCVGSHMNLNLINKYFKDIFNKKKVFFVYFMRYI